MIEIKDPILAYLPAFLFHISPLSSCMSSLLQTGKSGTKILFVNDPDHPDGLEEDSRILGVGMWFSRC